MKTYQSKFSFTIIEFIFVILIIAIISSFLIPNISSSSSNANLISLKNDFLLINKAIKEKTKENVFKNNTNTLLYLEDDNILFSNILNNFNSNNWEKISVNSYRYILNKNDSIIFTFNSDTQIFSCNKELELCQKVLN